MMSEVLSNPLSFLYYMIKGSTILMMRVTWALLYFT